MMRFVVTGLLLCLLAPAGCIMTSVGTGGDPTALAPGAIPPKGKHESPLTFEKRLSAQRRSSVVIPPKGKNESVLDFERRLSAQQSFTPAKQN